MFLLSLSAQDVAAISFFSESLRILAERISEGACHGLLHPDTLSHFSVFSILYTEASAADKLSEQRICRYIFASDPYEVIKEFQQTLRFQILF